MLTEIYIEALVVDEELADQVGRLGISGLLVACPHFWCGGTLPILPILVDDGLAKPPNFLRYRSV